MPATMGDGGGGGAEKVLRTMHSFVYNMRVGRSFVPFTLLRSSHPCRDISLHAYQQWIIIL